MKNPLMRWCMNTQEQIIQDIQQCAAMCLKLELSSLKVKLDANIFKKPQHNSLSFFFVQSHGNHYSTN